LELELELELAIARKTRAFVFKVDTEDINKAVGST